MSHADVRSPHADTICARVRSQLEGDFVVKNVAITAWVFVRDLRSVTDLFMAMGTFPLFLVFFMRDT